MSRYTESTKVAAPALLSTRLLDLVRESIRHLYYSVQVKKACLYEERFFIHRHGQHGPIGARAHPDAVCPGVSVPRSTADRCLIEQFQANQASRPSGMVIVSYVLYSK